jgi:hypothetical protein
MTQQNLVQCLPARSVGRQLEWIRDWNSRRRTSWGGDYFVRVRDVRISLSALDNRYLRESNEQAQLSYLQVCALKIACQSIRKCMCRFYVVCRTTSWRNDSWSKCRRACATREGFPAHLTLRPLGQGDSQLGYGAPPTWKLRRAANYCHVTG